MSGAMKLFRPLPAVILVGAVLLGVKGNGLIHAALAENSAPSLIVEDTSPLPADITAENETASSGESDVMGALGKRRLELDAREAELNERANIVAAAEKRVDGKIETLKTLQKQIEVLLGQRDEAEQKQLASLVKTYSSMKPKDAARIFNTLDDEVLIPVAAMMKSDVLGQVMASMNADAAQKLTVALANRLKAPQLAAPAAPEADERLVCSPLTSVPPPPAAAH